MATAADLQQAVAAEITRYGSLDNAIAGLWNDACEARPGSRVQDILNAALKLQSERKAEAHRVVA
jgi:hypothetical protein